MSASTHFLACQLNFDCRYGNWNKYYNLVAFDASPRNSTDPAPRKGSRLRMAVGQSGLLSSQESRRCSMRTQGWIWSSPPLDSGSSLSKCLAPFSPMERLCSGMVAKLGLKAWILVPTSQILFYQAFHHDLNPIVTFSHRISFQYQTNYEFHKIDTAKRWKESIWKLNWRRGIISLLNNGKLRSDDSFQQSTNPKSQLPINCCILNRKGYQTWCEWSCNGPFHRGRVIKNERVIVNMIFQLFLDIVR